MTPEQEILEDALAAARQRAATFARELDLHAHILPLDPREDWSQPSDDVRMEMDAFVKRYEMTQDLITRRLFRSVLAVRGQVLRGRSLAVVVGEMEALGIVEDAPRWEEITKLRNSFAHDYALTFAEIVPLINQAWTFSPDLLAMIWRVDRFAATHDLLASEPNHD